MLCTRCYSWHPGCGSRPSAFSAAGPQVEGAESRLHAVIELVVRNLVVSKKVHVDDEEEALLYVNDWFAG